MQRNAPARGAVGTESVVVSAGSVASATARGKSDPSRGRDTRVDDRDDRGGLPDCADGAGARRGPTRGAPPCDTPASNTRGRDHTRRRSRRGGCSADRFSGEAACPRRRSGGALRLDTARQTVAQERRLARSVGASRRSPRVWRFKLQALTSSAARLSLRAPHAQAEEAVDADGAMDAQNAPTAPWKTRAERGFPTSVHSHSLFVQKKRRTEDRTPLRRRRSRFTRFQVSADTMRRCRDPPVAKRR